MRSSLPSRWAAVLQALLVTFLWSTSWVLIKIGLQEIPALTFAGLRYALATVCLLPFAALSSRRNKLQDTAPHVRPPRRSWAGLILLGLLFYAVTQGAQFLGLAYLPAVTVSLMLNFTSVLVAWMGVIFLAERPTRLQWLGVFLFATGVVVYFYPVKLPASQITGLGIVAAGVVANAVSSVLGRAINRRGDFTALQVTVTSMGTGSLVLLAAGILTQGFPKLSLAGWGIIAWLAIVNTAFAFTLWNHTLRTLSAFESSIINGTMLVQIAILAWLFLGESLTGQEVIGLVVAGSGAVAVQLRSGRAG